MKIEERTESMEEKANLKAVMEKTLKEIDELRSQNNELEAKLKESKKESKKNRQRADKLQAMLEKINTEPNESFSESSEVMQDANIETHNNFSPLFESPSEQSTSESTHPSTKDQQVQTEVIFNPYDCFYCGNRLETTDQLKTHTEVCHGRPWDIFCCEQCTLNFSDVGDLKKHVEKCHDPAKLLHCLQELFKPKVKNRGFDGRFQESF